MPRRLTAALAVALLAIAPVAKAQNFGARAAAEPIPTVTGTLAITNARVVRAPGAVLDRATVVVRDGVITAVGPDVAVPYDARVIAGDSLWVYPGFVDAASYAGIPEEAAGQPQPVDDPDNAPPARAGVQPDRDARTLYKGSDASVTALRDLGFTTAQVFPRGGMLPGAGAAVLLGSAAGPVVLKSGAAQGASYEAARGVAPGTPMAVTARFRQVHREAARRAALAGRYAADPSGMAPPPWDAAHAAYAPVAAGEVPLYFHVNTALETHRALSLSAELGFRITLTGVGEGFELAEKLARLKPAMALTLALPEAPEWAASLKADSLEALMASYDPAERAADYRDQEAELQNLRSRQLLARKDYVANAATLAKAGLRFGFATRDAKAEELRRNVLAMVEAGLPADAALAALTIDGARLLGVDDAVGTIDPGKLGNLVVTDGDWFAEETRVRHVVVAGEVFEPAARTERGASRGGSDRPSR